MREALQQVSRLAQSGSERRHRRASLAPMTAQLMLRSLSQLLRSVAIAVCMSKSHVSLSHDPALKGQSTGHPPGAGRSPPWGAGFLVALCGDIQLMPGLGRQPAYTQVDVDKGATGLS